MRAWARAAVAAAALAAAAPASADPGAVYTDFATDGVLGCNHPRSDLQAVLSDATLNQYGDPLTLARLKLAIRKQLAGGCRGAGTRAGAGAPSAGTAATTATVDNQGNRSPGKPGDTGARFKPGSATVAAAADRTGQSDGGVSSSLLVIGAVLLVLLAVGGWVASRALAERR